MVFFSCTQVSRQKTCSGRCSKGHTHYHVDPAIPMQTPAEVYDMKILCTTNGTEPEPRNFFLCTRVCQ